MDTQTIIAIIFLAISGLMTYLISRWLHVPSPRVPRGPFIIQMPNGRKIVIPGSDNFKEVEK